MIDPQLILKVFIIGVLSGIGLGMCLSYLPFFRPGEEE